MSTEPKDLSEQEQTFLDLLFDANGMRHPEEAKLLAGYPKEYPLLKIVKKINKQLIEKCDDYLALHAPQGIHGLMQIMAEPNEPGSKIKLQAVVELLDRAGVVKKEKTELAVQSPNYVFYLPPKNEIKE